MSVPDVGRAWLDRAYQYADDVKSGVIPSCKYIQLAVDRWFDDMNNGPSRGLQFSEYHAARYFRFVGRHCRHYEGEWAGKKIDFEPWQCFADANLFGWIREDGTRRFRQAYEEVARKNGKSTRIAAAGNFYLIGDNEPGAQIYSAATKKEQARLIFESSKAMLEQSPALARLCTIEEHKLKYQRSKYLPLSKDSKRMDGFNVHAGLVDELHAHPNSGLWDVMRSAMGARKQPIMRAITTAGFDHNSYCYQRRRYAIQVLEGAVKDDAFFTTIYTLDDPEKWDDPAEWPKANPNLGVSVSLTDLQEQCEEAKHLPSAKTEFLTKRLNLWVYGETAWMPMQHWHQCKDPNLGSLDDATELDGQECYGGLDLSAVEDMTTFGLVFPGESGQRTTLSRSYLPQAALERRLKQGDKTLETFRDSGHLIVLPGQTVDYNFIKADIMAAAERFDLQSIAFDRWNSSQLVSDLIDEGIDFIEFGQGYGSMSAPSKELLRLVLNQQLRHNDPLLTWAVSNVVVQTDPAGNIKPDKGKVSEKIDPAVALIMGIALAMAGDDGEDSQDFVEF